MNVCWLQASKHHHQILGTDNVLNQALQELTDLVADAHRFGAVKVPMVIQTVVVSSHHPCQAACRCDFDRASHAGSPSLRVSAPRHPFHVSLLLLQVPIVEVSARALLPSTSVITFTLGAGLSFTTFVNTVPISEGRTINRFALVRKLGADKLGIFNMALWDGMARKAMIK